MHFVGSIYGSQDKIGIYLQSDFSTYICNVTLPYKADFVLYFQ